MEPELNCSSHCDSRLCLIHAGVNRQEGLDILHRLCSLSTLAVELPRRSLSPVLSAVVWTLLSGGILLTFCFLLFTLRFKNNRIVKMSSPNLNILTLMGSLLTYSSGFLFAVDERAHWQGGSSASAAAAALQARMWTLCIGSTLVFGPILGKTWRLYRVFTQRLPDKRVIIRDIQLMGLVAALILVDLLVLTFWNLSDPIRCSRSVAAIVKVEDADVSYSLSQTDSCSSQLSDLWAIIIAVQKGSLLLYGTYLAGLTSNVSHPPVNQSPTIITAVTLVTVSSAVVVPVSIFLRAWPNLVYSAVAGAIFICTLATNCVLFVPQLTQWRQFEEDQNNPGQMAKYFSSPSKSQPSMYSQDEIYYLLGENTSMKKLLNEKNAVIDSLQEQVSNAKEKLLRLMSASRSCEDQEQDQDQDLDLSASNLNSSSTQTTDLQSDGPSSASVPLRDARSQLPPAAPASPSVLTGHPASPDTPRPVQSPLPRDWQVVQSQKNQSGSGLTNNDAKAVEGLHQPASPPVPSGLTRTTEEAVDFVTSLQSRRGLNPFQIDTTGNPGVPASHLRPTGFVSSEQLQEILQELSLDAFTDLRSPPQTARTAPLPKFPEASALSPLSLRLPRSPHPPVLFRYPSISPYAMRKRRPPFNASRRGLSPPCFYEGCGKIAENCERQNPAKDRDGLPVDGALLEAQNSDVEEEEEEEEEEAGRDKAARKSQRSVARRPRNRAAPPDPEAGGDGEHHRRHIRDSCGYWDSDSSSSTDYCYYHRPYCDSCLQRGSLLSTDSSSDSSDGEYEGFAGLYRPSHPVVFKEDLKPTFV